jgi:hypothetical protein
MAPRAAGEGGPGGKMAHMGEQQTLQTGVITLGWSGWVPWPDVLIDNRGGAEVLIPKPGVY